MGMLPEVTKQIDTPAKFIEGVAQLVEQEPFKLLAQGSNPCTLT